MVLSAALSFLATHTSGYSGSSYTTTTSSSGDSAAAGAVLAGLLVYMLFLFAIVAFAVVCQWKIFTKAGKPGWASIVPIYNQIVMLEIVNKPVWWVVLMFVPIASIVVAILVAIELARVFGKSDGFAALLILVPIVGLPMLAFGNATYRGGSNHAPQMPGGSGMMPPTTPIQ